MDSRESILLSRARQGDVESFEYLVRPYQQKLFRLIMAIAHNNDDAEDALQETLLQIFRAISSFRGDASFNTWIHRIAINVTRNWIRSQSRGSSDRYLEQGHLIISSNNQDLDSTIVQEEERKLVRKALLSLPCHYRDALLLRHYRDMSYEEIADVLQIPVGTVKSRIAQGRAILLQRLSGLGYLETASTR